MSTVAILVDGTQVGTATYGGVRADVCNALPGRPGCPNVGWSYSLDVSSLSSGTHTLKVVATDTSGLSGSNQVTFQTGVRPFVHVDAPVAGATLSGTTSIGGWAIEGLDTVGANAITAMAVFVDGTQVGTANYGANRGDVCAAFPGRPGCPNVGWDYSLDVTAFSAGNHTLTIVATDAAGLSGSTQTTFTK